MPNHISNAFGYWFARTYTSGVIEFRHWLKNLRYTQDMDVDRITAQTTEVT